MSDWQPIETCPLPAFNADRWYAPVMRCLIFDRYIDIASYGYTQRGKGRWKNSLDRVAAPTHWMPLPEPPR